MKNARRIISLTLTLIVVLAFGSLAASADFDGYGDTEIIYSDEAITIYATEFDVSERPMPMYIKDHVQGTADPTQEFTFQCEPDEGNVFRLEVSNTDSENDMRLEIECEVPRNSPMNIVDYIDPGKGKIYSVEDNTGAGLDIECVTVISAYRADTVEYDYYALQTTD